MHHFFARSRWVLGFAVLIFSAACTKQAPSTSDSTTPSQQPTQAGSSPTFEDHIKQSNVFFKQAKLTEALAALQAAGQVSPTRYEAPALAALVWHAAGKPDEARQALADARKLAPTEKPAGLDKIERELATPVASTSVDSKPTTAEQRRRCNVLMLVMEDAEKAGDLSSRQRLLREFLDQSATYVKDFPDDGKVWILRAQTCVELERADDGILAARALEGLGLANSTDPKIARIVANLDRKGWFNAKTSGERRAKNHAIANLGIELIWIDPGNFSMGSASGGDNDERPVTMVTLSRGFWLAQTEVTQAQWQAVMGSNPSNFKGTNLPVEQVNWTEAMEFCRKLTERERAAGRLPAGYAYTLPTEAQWEYACRAGTTGEYAGDLNAMAWYKGNSGDQTHPVAQKQPNAWGLYDMHGNVWEWCLDWYGDYPGGSVTDPKGAASGSYRVNRGGSWRFFAAFCRSANRDRAGPGIRWGNLGFRLALSSSP